VSKQILVNASHYETRVATLENSEIRQLHIEREEDKNVVGNIYKGIVKRVLPGMQAAFLELGLERTAFLYVDDIIEEPLGMDFEYDEVEQSQDETALDEEPMDSFAEAEESERGKQAPRRRNDRRRRPGASRRPARDRAKIQDLLKEGQELLVQVAKAPIGTKGARLTTHVSLPGRNVVLMPTLKHVGISRKIESDQERRRLRDLFAKRIHPRNVGFIVRTVAAGKSLREIKADADYLIKLWARIQRDFRGKKAPALIHEDLSLAMRTVRDLFTEDIDSFIIDHPREYEEVLRFIGHFMPRLKSRVKLFRGPSQLFEHYGIEAEISRALGKKIWLKSGGYLLIDQSEALTAIDVNTGRYVGSKSLEETILKTNLEAVREISYQLRIRNVGGIIIIDLIDMESAENRDKVYRALHESLGEDRAKTNILKISELGLVEMTRKRTHEDLVRYLTEPCSYCDGRGYHKSKRTVCFEVFREIEKEALNPSGNIVVFANPQVTGRIRSEEKNHVSLLERRLNRQITVKTDESFHVEQFEVFGK
jgi:ribonuclease G